VALPTTTRVKRSSFFGEIKPPKKGGMEKKKGNLSSKLKNKAPNLGSNYPTPPNY